MVEGQAARFRCCDRAWYITASGTLLQLRCDLRPVTENDTAALLMKAADYGVRDSPAR